MITFRQKGDFSNSLKYLKSLERKKYLPILEKYARIGVDALRTSTPRDTGITAESWDYNIEINKKGFNINWTNSNIVGNVPLVILLQYGHATRSGSFVSGEDFINPAIRPVFDKMVQSLWKEVGAL